MTDKDIFTEDYEYILNQDHIPFEKLKNTTFLITGGTGLIGSTLINALLYANEYKDFHTNVIALVRDVSKAKKMLRSSDFLTLLEGSVEVLPPIAESVDYVIHAASPTASKFFISNPVETIKAGVLGTINCLELAKEKKAKGFLYLSSMEAYGTVCSEKELKEDHLGYLNSTDARSCYPESKRICEALCSAYAREYGLKAASIRLAQTFGPGISYQDQRVFAMMARCALTNKDIVLQTKGTSKHSYLYTAQAVTAILTVLLKGTPGAVYNAANPKTYCSIYEMAQMVAKELASNQISVRIAENGDVTKYPATSYLNLNIDAIAALGWKPEGDLIMLYRRMIAGMDIQ